MIMTIVIVRTTPIRPGTMLYCVIALGVVEGVDAQLDRAGRAGEEVRAGL